MLKLKKKSDVVDNYFIFKSNFRPSTDGIGEKYIQCLHKTSVTGVQHYTKCTVVIIIFITRKSALFKIYTGKMKNLNIMARYINFCSLTAKIKAFAPGSLR